MRITGSFMIVASLLLVAATGTASGAVMAYENFDNTLYTAGNLDGQAPTVPAFTDEWRTAKSGGGGWTEGDWQKFDAISAGLSYSDGTNSLVTTDGAARYVSTYDDTYRITRDLSSPSAPSAYYASYLLAYTSDWNGSEGSIGYVGDRGVMIALRPGGDGTVDAYATGDELDMLVAEDLAADTAYFFVVRAEDASNPRDNVKVWMNPTDLTDEAANSYVEDNNSYVNYSEAPQNRLSLQSDGDTGGLIYDEARYGETWGDVTPIPEPATMALLGLGGLGVLVRRRR